MTKALLDCTLPPDSTVERDGPDGPPLTSTLNGRFSDLPASALWRDPPLIMKTASGRSGHRAARQVFEKPPFTPKTAEFRLATCEWPVYTQLRTLASTSALAALWWKPTLNVRSIFLSRTAFPDLDVRYTNGRFGGAKSQWQLSGTDLGGTNECCVPFAA